MHRSYEYRRSSSYEYNSSSSSYYNVSSYSPTDEHIENIVRMQKLLPTMPAPQFPRFLNFDEVPGGGSNYAYAAEDKDRRRNVPNTNRSKKTSYANNHQKQHRVPDQKVQFIVNEKKPDEDRNVDMEADRFIQQKRKNFDFCK